MRPSTASGGRSESFSAPTEQTRTKDVSLPSSEAVVAKGEGQPLAVLMDSSMSSKTSTRGSPVKTEGSPIRTEGSLRHKVGNLQLQPIPEKISMEYTMEQLRSNEVMTRMLREGLEENPDDASLVSSAVTMSPHRVSSQLFGDGVDADALTRSPDFAAYLGSDLRRHMFPDQTLRVAFEELACQGDRITVNTLCTYFQAFTPDLLQRGEKAFSELEAAKMLSAVKPLGWKTGIKREDFMRLYLVLAGKPYKTPDSHFLDAECPWGEEDLQAPVNRQEVNVRQLQKQVTHTDVQVYSRNTRVVLPAGQKKASHRRGKKDKERDRERPERVSLAGSLSSQPAARSPRHISLGPGNVGSALFRKASARERVVRDRAGRGPSPPVVRKNRRPLETTSNYTNSTSTTSVATSVSRVVTPLRRPGQSDFTGDF